LRVAHALQTRHAHTFNAISSTPSPAVAARRRRAAAGRPAAVVGPGQTEITTNVQMTGFGSAGPSRPALAVSRRPSCRFATAQQLGFASTDQSRRDLDACVRRYP
jgi:hypothetical protein